MAIIMVTYIVKVASRINGLNGLRSTQNEHLAIIDKDSQG